VSQLIHRCRGVCPGNLAPAVRLPDEVSRGCALGGDRVLPEPRDRARSRKPGRRLGQHLTRIVVRKGTAIAGRMTLVPLHFT
jgi:hypothetical protein